ncbi:hypothetical protein [Streptomyces sp. NPDC059063]|uniref:hypothetical protein n=1 Tax=unclassified Streptomyces TaxID=2593676 RepID=UPI0036BC8925
MAAAQIVVHRPSPEGGRRVEVRGQPVGVAYNLADVAEFLRRAGLDVDPVEVAVLPLIDWRGGGPDVWEPGGEAGGGDPGGSGGVPGGT